MNLRGHGQSLHNLPKGTNLPKFYNLTCSCGLSIPVETNQAGRTFNCSCGQQLQVPSLSGILMLAPIPEQEAGKNEKVKPAKSATSRSIHTKQVVMVIGVIAFVVTSLIFVLGARKYPQLHDVCIMQRHFVHGDKVVGRDSLPISPRDFRLLVDERLIPSQFGLLVWSEEVINRFPDLDYRPIFLIEMHDNFKGGPELSYNFYEKYDKLVFYYWARFVVFGVLAIVSLIVLFVGIFLPKHVEDIGERGGESWE